MSNTTALEHISANVIKLYKGEETGIINENFDSKDSSIFAKQYTMALSEIKAYLDTFEDKNSRQSNSEVKDRSNIFAFIGDRGTGKTSCMQSVAGMLEQYYTSTGTKKTFMPLPIIDPTIFDDNTNILQVVIGTLFNQFKEEINHTHSFGTEKEDKEFEADKQEVLKAFQDVKDCIKIISNPDLLKCEGNDISQLADMASVSQLHNKMGSLVKNYLHFCKQDVFVLQVDDIDLQTKYAYKMVDDIRKYFVLPDVIILMSFKLEQLQKVIELENTRNYELLIKNQQILPSDIQEMAARYILKLIPINHRIYMPTLDVYADSLIEYLPNHNKESKTLIGEGFKISVKYAITSLIFKKCRYLFYHSKGVVSPIVPTNLRELRHLLAMLVEMDDYYSGLPNEEMSQKTNKIQFLNYFYNIWINNNIMPADYGIVKNLIAVRDAAALNKTVLMHLQSRFEEVLTKSFDNILNLKNSTYNISLADVYDVVDYIKQRLSNNSDKSLIFFVETLYSIRLYEYYDELTDAIRINEEKQDNTNVQMYDASDYTDESIRKISITDGISNYELLVGGCVIDARTYPFIARDRKYCWADGRYMMKYSELKKEVSRIIEGMVSEKYKIHIVELLALCTSRTWSSNDAFNRDYRTQNEIYYIFDSKSNTELIEFDLGSFFFNIINAKRAYDRLHPGYYEYIKQEKDSLYNQLLNSAYGLREGWCKNKKHALLSCAAIRNYEVLSDFINRMMHTSLSGSEGNILENVINYISNISSEEFAIKTYDRKAPKNNQPGQPQVISFEYASVIVDNVVNEHINDNAIAYFNEFFETPPSNMFQEFDIEGIMSLFKLKSYAKSTVRRNIQQYCKPILENNKALNKYLNEIVDKESGNEEGRFEQPDIRKILTLMKQTYENK